VIPVISIDEEKMFLEIKERKPKVVVLNAPDGLLNKALEVASKVQKSFGVQVVTIANPCYGICDTIDGEAEKLGADMVFHIGHNIATDRVGKRTILIDVIDDVDFGEVLKASLQILRRYRKVGLCTISQHIHNIEKARLFLEENGISVIIGKGKGLLKDGQVLGCDFCTAFGIRESVNAFAFLGQSIFHTTGIALATGKVTFMLDPYYKEITDVTSKAFCISKRTTLSTYKALDAKTIGIVIGLKEGQTRLERAQSIKSELERYGKDVSFIALNEINNENLTRLRKMDAFIQTACPRISIDDSFDRPVLSIPQAEALIRLLDGKELGEIFQRSSWV